MILSNNVTDHPVEFEDDAPLELKESSPDVVSEDESNKPSKALDQVFEKDQAKKDVRNAKIKETPEPLRITKKRIMKKDYQPKDYIAVQCHICEREYTHAKKEEDGSFTPYALCQHIAFKGIVEVE
jgi:hypothetical protein